MIFLHGDLEEEVYMEQHGGFIKDSKDCMCKLKKSVSDNFFMITLLFLLLYVFDILVLLKHVFSMKYLGVSKEIFGMKFERDRASWMFFLSQ